MLVCKQAVITADGFPELVGEYEDLDYAMVMPWIEGDTWFDTLEKRQKVTLDQSRALAESMAWVLYALELNQLAHCDLSSGNVIIDPNMDQVHLVDVEDLYSPWLNIPPMVPAGTPGYHHKESSKNGQWSPLGDRFAGIILMAEMLGWAHPDVRAKAWGESYFSPNEVQQQSERYDTLIKALRIYASGFAEAFEAAWQSEKLEQCPPLKTWYDLLDALPRDPVANWAPISQKEFKDEIETLHYIEASKNQQSVIASTEIDLSQEDISTTPFKGLWRSGCRVALMVVLVVGLLGCCITALIVQWSFMTNGFQ
jgi:serine/threonine protein kinase